MIGKGSAPDALLLLLYPLLLLLLLVPSQVGEWLSRRHPEDAWPDKRDQRRRRFRQVNVAHDYLFNIHGYYLQQISLIFQRKAKVYRPLPQTEGSPEGFN